MPVLARAFCPKCSFLFPLPYDYIPPTLSEASSNVVLVHVKLFLMSFRKWVSLRVGINCIPRKRQWGVIENSKLWSEKYLGSDQQKSLQYSIRWTLCSVSLLPLIHGSKVLKPLGKTIIYWSQVSPSTGPNPFLNDAKSFRKSSSGSLLTWNKSSI